MANFIAVRIGSVWFVGDRDAQEFVSEYCGPGAQQMAECEADQLNEPEAI